MKRGFLAALAVLAVAALAQAAETSLTRLSQQLQPLGVKLTVEANPFAADRKIESLQAGEELGGFIAQALESHAFLKSAGLGRGITEVRVAAGPVAQTKEDGTRITFFVNPLASASGFTSSQVSSALMGGSASAPSGASGSAPGVQRSWERIGEIRQGLQSRAEFDGAGAAPAASESKFNDQAGVVFLGGGISGKDPGFSGAGGAAYLSFRPKATKVIEYQPGYGLFVAKSNTETIAEEVGIQGNYDWSWKVTDYVKTRTTAHDFGRVLLAPRIGPVTPYAGVGLGVTKQSVTTGKLDEFHVFQGSDIVDRDDFKDENTKDTTSVRPYLAAGVRVAVSKAVSVIADYARPPLMKGRFSLGVGFSWK